jgi:hypothetical protein
MAVAFRAVRPLTLAAGVHPRGATFISAASGLVRVRDTYYIVADDELHLGVFRAGSDAPLELVRLFAGDLPEAAAVRKALKPDLESLLLLPSSPARPHGALLALGSGSRPNRCRGALINLDDAGAVRGIARSVDLRPLYGRLDGHFATLNIEGAFVAGAELVLLQRGGRDARNSVVRFDLATALAALEGEAEPPLPRSVRDVALGAVGGVPLAFTDGAALPDGRWVFSAVAEDSADAYDDGACAAAAIGVADGSDVLHWLEPLDPVRKVEGIDARIVDGTLQLALVTDGDDPGTPAELGSVSIAWR